jgi:hypothetical protein
VLKVMNTSKKRLPKFRSLAAFAKSLDLDRERRDALERVVALWETDSHGGVQEGEELMKALDVLAITHTAATFEWASGSFS